MADNILLWVSPGGNDLDRKAVEAIAPDLIVRLSNAEMWPKEIGGIPVKQIYELIDGGQAADCAHLDLLDWLSAASHVRGADGRQLGEVRTASGFPLWWCVDQSLSQSIGLKLRTVESLSSLLKVATPRRMTVWGSNADHGWLRQTVAEFLEARGASGANIEIILAPAWRAAEIAQKSHWEKAGLSLTSFWSPLGADQNEPVEWVGQGETVADGMVFRTYAEKAFFQSSVGGTVMEARLRWRRGEGFGTAFELGDGRYSQRVSIADGSVRLGSDQIYRIDTSIFRNYRLELRGALSRLYVDGTFVLELAGRRGGWARKIWGHLDANNLTTTEWAYVIGGSRVSDLSHQSAGSDAGNTPLATLLTLPPSSGHDLPSRIQASPEPGGVVVMGWGSGLSCYTKTSGLTVDDAFAENILDGLTMAGMPASFLSIGQPHPRLNDVFKTTDGIAQLRRWWPEEGKPDTALTELQTAWWAWRGKPAIVGRFPHHQGVETDTLAANFIEGLLPDFASAVKDAAALGRYVDSARPRAVIFSHFASSHRHMIEPLRQRGIRTIANTIGLQFQRQLFYGLEGEHPDCPRADAYFVWGEMQADRLRPRCPTCQIGVPGRTRQDSFVEAARAATDRGWLKRIGLDPQIERVIVFGDVLRSTIKENILAEETWIETVRALLESVADRPDIAVVVKPWAGDHLLRLRQIVHKIGDAKLHVFDPYTMPFHNADLLKHAVTVVSSPTSLLAEFASMGGLPLLLRLPETEFYYGAETHNQCAAFCQEVRSIGDLPEAIRQLLASPMTTKPDAAARERGLRPYFGPSDGNSAARFTTMTKTVIM